MQFISAIMSSTIKGDSLWCMPRLVTEASMRIQYVLIDFATVELLHANVDAYEACLTSAWWKSGQLIRLEDVQWTEAIFIVSVRFYVFAAMYYISEVHQKALLQTSLMLKILQSEDVAKQYKSQLSGPPNSMSSCMCVYACAYLSNTYTYTLKVDRANSRYIAIIDLFKSKLKCTCSYRIPNSGPGPHSPCPGPDCTNQRTLQIATVLLMGHSTHLLKAGLEDASINGI